MSVTSTASTLNEINTSYILEMHIAQSYAEDLRESK
jgi:hypothetical protein